MPPHPLTNFERQKYYQSKENSMVVNQKIVFQK